MRILDRYLLREFAWPLLYCFDAFVLMWIVQDLLDNLSEFLQASVPVRRAIHYYLIVLPDAFVLILPMSLLLAVLFCLSSLGRHNELTAFRASGISQFRLALPLLGAGVLASFIVFVVNEAYVPRAKERADAFRKTLKGKGEQDVIENLFFANATEHRYWYAPRFNLRAKELSNVEIHQQTPRDETYLDVFADRAQWQDGAWRFYDARINGGPLVAVTNFPAFNESPRRLAAESKKPDQLTTTELHRLIRAFHRSGRTANLAEYRVTVHYRYAFPLTCLIVVWLGIPLGMRVSRRGGALLGVGVALLLVVAFYFLTHISLALGKGERVPPALAAWLTNAVFASVGAVLLARSR